MHNVAQPDKTPHPSVQTWSRGPIFPAVIARVDSHLDGGVHYATEWEVTVPGHNPIRYSTRELAEQQARGQLERDRQGREDDALLAELAKPVDPALQHRNAPYQLLEERGWWYVVDPRTGNRSKPHMSEAGARIAMHGLRIRNLSSSRHVETHDTAVSRLARRLPGVLVDRGRRWGGHPRPPAGRTFNNPTKGLIMRDPFTPIYPFAYVNPHTGEIVRGRLSPTMVERACEALKGQGVTKMHVAFPGDAVSLQYQEAAVRRWEAQP